MLERIYRDILKGYAGIAEKKYRKLLLLSLFLLNLSIYSIPLILFHLDIIRIPTVVLEAYTNFISKLIPFEKEIHQNSIIIKEFAFIIDQECIGIKSILGFFAIIMATPTRNIKKRLRYFLILSPLIFSLNIIRILSVIFMFYFFNLNPYFLHDFLWQIINTVFITFLWLVFYIKNKNDLVIS